MQHAAVGGFETDRDEAEREVRGALRQQMLRHRNTGEAVNLQRALDALGVCRLQSRCGHRIDARELGMHRRPASLARFGIQLMPKAGIGLGE